MTTTKKAAPTAPKKATPKKTTSAKAAPTVKIEKVRITTIDDLIEGALENIAHQMKQPVFSRLTRDDHAKAARENLMGEAARNPALTDMDPKKLYRYLTDQLEITDKK